MHNDGATTIGQEARLTLNHMGWASVQPHEINLAFADFAATSTKPVLDIGAGFGVASKEALLRGAKVIVNDLSADHLIEFWASLDRGQSSRTTAIYGKFPDDLSFPSGTLGAIHICNVIHFLNPAEFERGLNKMHEWLQPGGKLFMLAVSPYQQPLKGFVPEFECRMATGVDYPGWVENIGEYSSHPLLELLPSSLLLFNAESISRAFRSNEFQVEELREYSRSGIPAACRFDGRENVLLVARKAD